MEEILIKAMEELDEDIVLEYSAALLNKGYSYLDIQRFLNEGMKRVRLLFESGEYFIADLIVSGMIYTTVLDTFYINEHECQCQSSIGKVVIGVMKNDIHDIGKNIVCSSLRAQGFEVIDLGVDVDKDTFVENVLKLSPDILALSGVLTDSTQEMKIVIEAIKEKDLNIPIVIGGNCANDKVRECIGANYYVKGPFDLLKICMKMVDDKYVEL